MAWLNFPVYVEERLEESRGDEGDKQGQCDCVTVILSTTCRNCPRRRSQRSHAYCAIAPSTQARSLGANEFAADSSEPAARQHSSPDARSSLDRYLIQRFAMLPLDYWFALGGQYHRWRYDRQCPGRSAER